MPRDEITQEIYAMRQNLLVFEQKYDMPSETFLQAYQNGEEPADTTWVLEWAEWAGTYKILQRRLMQATDVMQRLSSNEESS